MSKMSNKVDEYIDNGYILLARQITVSEIFYKKPAQWFKIWIYILLSVSWKNSKRFKRGTGFFSWPREKLFLNDVSKWQWFHFLQWAREEKMIATQKTTRGIIIEVLNYNKYQTPDNYEKAK